jgi:hypothetical protein
MVLICLHRPLHGPESTAHASIEAISPLPKASVGTNNARENLRSQKFCPRTFYKTFIESKEKVKASKMKERTERKLKVLKTAQKREKSGSQKIE